MTRIRSWWWRATSVDYGRHSRRVVLRTGVPDPTGVDHTRPSLAEELASEEQRKPSTAPLKVPRGGAVVRRGPRP